MIERYSRKEIKSIWEDYNRYSIWLEIELAAAEAMEKLKMIPKKRLENAKILSKNSIAFFTPPTYSENEISYIQKKIESVFFKSIKV